MILGIETFFILCAPGIMLKHNPFALYAPFELKLKGAFLLSYFKDN